MIRVLTIDDEPLALRLLAAFIGRIDDLQLIAGCQSAEAAGPYIAQADAVFIDIDMPGISGMDFIKSLPDPPLVVFTTAYSEYAVEGYKVNAVDYLLKPFSFEDFEMAVARLRERIGLLRGKSREPEGRAFMFFKTDYRSVRVQCEDIVYVEGLGAYVKIHLSSADNPLITLYSLKRLAEDLASDGFIRIHKSFIVNPSYIKSARKTSVLLRDGTSLPVGEAYKEGYLMRMERYDF